MRAGVSQLAPILLLGLGLQMKLCKLFITKLRNFEPENCNQTQVYYKSSVPFRQCLQ